MSRLTAAAVPLLLWAAALVVLASPAEASANWGTNTDHIGFTDTYVGQQKAALVQAMPSNNDGVISGVHIDPEDDPNFSVLPDQGCMIGGFPKTIQNGHICGVYVQFHPTVPGTFAVSVVFEVDDLVHPHLAVAIDGTAVEAPATVPGQPVAVSAVATSTTSANVFVTPGSDGGSAITSYDARCYSFDGGANSLANHATSPVAVTGLTPGQHYHCQARTWNAVSHSAWSSYSPTFTTTVTSSPPPPPLGSATGVAIGTGKRYVVLPAAIRCGTHTARLRFTSRAGRVARVVVKASGVRVATIRRPTAGSIRTVHGIPASATRLVLTIRLKSGAIRSVRRSYRHC